MKTKESPNSYTPSPYYHALTCEIYENPKSVQKWLFRPREQYPLKSFTCLWICLTCALQAPKIIQKH